MAVYKIETVGQYVDGLWKCLNELAEVLDAKVSDDLRSDYLRFKSDEHDLRLTPIQEFLDEPKKVISSVHEHYPHLSDLFLLKDRLPDAVKLSIL